MSRRFNSNILHTHRTQSTLIKPIETLITEFEDVFRIGSDLKINLEFKIKFLESFLSSFVSNFKQDNKAYVSIIQKLDENLETICLALLLNIVQLESSKMRLISLRLVLYLSHLDTFNTKFQQLQINNFIIRLIDLKPSEQDVLFSIEYIRLLVQMHHQFLSHSIVHCLIAAIEDPRSKLNNLIVETLLEIANVRPKLACECQIFNYLIDFLFNMTPESDFCVEVITQCFINTLEYSECRSLINLEDLLSYIISPLVDIDFLPLGYASFKDSDGLYEPKIENIIKISSTIVYTLMKSYNGLMVLTLNEAKIIKTLFSPLTWYLTANKRNINQNFLVNSKTAERELLIINSLLDLLHRIFCIDNITLEIFKSRGSSCLSSSGSMGCNLLEDDLVNQECESLFESLDSFSSQSNLTNMVIDNKISTYTSSLNLCLIYKAFMLKLMVELGIFEGLLDLYYGLPVSFVQTLCNDSNETGEMLQKYASISLTTVNLFAELYYMINTLFYNEYCIDDFTEGDSDSTSPYNSEKSVYNEMKKLSLISYLKFLDSEEREREIINYVTQFSSKKEMLKNGLHLQVEKLAKLGFYSQQFLANSGYLSSKKSQIELEILNNQIPSGQSEIESQSLSFFGSFFFKTDSSNLEELISLQIDQTQVLESDSYLTIDFKYKWNWLEIIKLFEFYLLTKSSFHPRFSPSQNAIELNSKLKNLFENKKVKKFFKKLFNFFSSSDIISAPNKATLLANRVSYSSIHQAINNFDQIACTGCYLLDFCLNNSYLNEKYLNQIVQKSIEYIDRELSDINEQKYVKPIAKESPIGIYILLLAHLTSSEKGNEILIKLNIHEIIIGLIEKSKDLSFIKLILSVFNFYVSKPCRLILEKSLCLNSIYIQCGPSVILQYNELKIYILKLLLNLYRANNLKFEVFFVKILIQCLFSIKFIKLENQSDEVKESFRFLISLKLVHIEYYLNQRIDFVDELVDEIENLEPLANIWIIRKSKILRVKLHFLIFRLKLSYQSLKNMEMSKVNEIIKEWYNYNLDKMFFKLTERKLFDFNAVNSQFSNEIDDREDFDAEIVDENLPKDKKTYRIYRLTNDFGRNYSQLVSAHSRIFLPFHLNTALTRLVCKHYFKNSFLDSKTVQQLKLIKNSINEKVNIRELKSALWSLSSMCINEDGFRYISNIIKIYKIFKNLFDLVSHLVKLAEWHGNLSIRSTCFICLNLISRSCTGANLLGKIGWHTFQPNRFTPVRAFYSLLSSLSKEQQVLSSYSSIDTAVILFNLNRSKSSIDLKQIKKYFYCDLSNYELEYLMKRNLVDLEMLDDRDFIKIYEKNKVAINFENFTVPIRISLMAVDENYEPFVYKKTQVNICFRCDLNNCIKCSLEKVLVSKKFCQRDLKFDQEIVDKMDSIVPLIEFEETHKKNAKRLLELKKLSPNSFDICMYLYVAKNYLSTFYVKYKLRKIIQDLFNDLNFIL